MSGAADVSANEHTTITIYDSHVERGFGAKTWRDMYTHLIASYDLTWRLFLRSFSSNYRQSIFGYVWAVAPTLVTVSAFSYLNAYNTLDLGSDGYPYVLYALLGMTAWQYFAMGLVRCTQSLTSAGAFVAKINFTRESLLLAGVMEALVDLLIRSMLVVPVLLWFQITPPWTVVLVPLVLIPFTLWILAIGFLLAAANAVVRDFGSAIGMAIMFLMLVCPVMYSPPATFPKSLINWLNPASPFVIAFRNLALQGHLTHPWELAVLSGLSVVAFIVSWRIFHLAMPRLIERL